MKLLRPLARLKVFRRKDHGTKPEDRPTVQSPASSPDAPVLSRRPSVETGSGICENNFIDRLHTDLLIMIFSILQSSESPLTSEGRKWIKVTHVCRKWRQISLAISGLWTYVDTKWGTIGSEFIARSGDAPLKLRIHIKEPASHRQIMAVNRAFAHIDRACELHFHVHRIEQLLEISDSLNLRNRSTPLEAISLHSELGAQFPHDFFRELHSTIRRLETSHVCLPSKLEIFPQLTHLKMNFEIFPHVPPSDVFSMLGYCFKLVDVEFYTFEWVDEPLDIAPTIALPFLRRICFAHCYSNCIRLLDHLILPPAVSLIMKDSCISGFPFPPIPTGLFSPSYDTCLLTISDWTSKTVASRFSSHDLQSCIDVHFLRLTSFGNPSLGLETFRSGFVAILPHLEHFTIGLALTHPLVRTTKSWSVAQIGAVLACMPNLRTMTLDEISFKPTCNELAENLLDALHTFTLINFKFPLSPSSDDKSLQKSILDCALSRSNYGAKLAKVDISSCRDVSATFVYELAQFVDIVIPPDASRPNLDVGAFS
ncbi:hypothetical protein BD410DRAFT_900091 [Rickenella mellea]|uniref:Uncharacterized protein n=1 Tax=Rickenella mellea TaxID=50990 RepID=A0A4Y7PY70_9AGAM|nr:hypothetical protein BD410DRAFT_900091 [Rickenella mellea]